MPSILLSAIILYLLSYLWSILDTLTFETCNKKLFPCEAVQNKLEILLQ